EEATRLDWAPSTSCSLDTRMRSHAGSLVVLPLSSVTRTRISALSSLSLAVKLRVENVRPGMSSPLRIHWYRRSPDPLAVTLKVASEPSDTISSDGPTEMVGPLPSWPLSSVRHPARTSARATQLPVNRPR